MMSLKSRKKQKLLKTPRNKPLKAPQNKLFKASRNKLFKALQNKLLKTLQNKLLNQNKATVFITLSDCKKSISKKRNTFFNSLVILPLIVFSNLALSQTLAEQDSSKPTVCTVTINSTDEKEVFQNYLEKDFNFVELTTLGEENISEEENSSEEDWFLGACQSGVQCDILVISGHFGGSFFGSSGYYLSLSELQRRSCQERCSGILKKPKEVFLFGCNTTAGKTADHRTPEEYTRVLIEDGFSRRQAEQVSAFRYSPIGEETQDRMKQVFPFSRIYGFHSLAPSGKNIRHRLNKYFKSIPNKDYISHLSSFPKKEENHFWSRAMKGQFIRSVDGVEDIENPMCVLENSESLYKKLMWIEEVLSDEERSLSYIPIIEHYFKDLERMFGEDWEDFPREEQSILEQIQFNSQGKNTVNELLSQAIPGVLSVQVTVLKFGKRIGWYDKEAYNKNLKFLIGDIFKENLDWEQRDLICSLRVEIDLRLEDLPEERWNRATVSTLSCVKPSDTRIHKELLRILQDKSVDIELREEVAYVLGRQNSLNLDAISALITFLQDNSVDVELRLFVASILKTQNSLNSDAISVLITFLLDKSEDIFLRKNVASALGKQNSLNSDVVSAFRTILEDKSVDIQLRKYVLDFGKRNEWYNKEAYSERLKFLIRDSFKDNLDRKQKDLICSLEEEVDLRLEDLPEERWNGATIVALGCVKPSDTRIHKELLRILQDKLEDIELRKNVASALGKQNSLNSDVVSAFRTILEDKSEDISLRKNVVYALTKQNSLNSDMISALIATLLDKSMDIELLDNSVDIELREEVAYVLGKQNSLNSDMISALITILKDISENIVIRRQVAWILAKQNPLNSDIISVLITILKDNSVDISLRKSVAYNLAKQNSLNSDIISVLITFLQNNSLNRDYQNHLTSDLIWYFKDPLNMSHTIVVIDELKQIASSNPEGAKHILKAISEEASLDEEIRRKATQTLQEINNH